MDLAFSFHKQYYLQTWSSLLMSPSVGRWKCKKGSIAFRFPLQLFSGSERIFWGRPTSLVIGLLYWSPLAGLFFFAFISTEGSCHWNISLNKWAINVKQSLPADWWAPPLHCVALLTTVSRPALNFHGSLILSSLCHSRAGNSSTFSKATQITPGKWIVNVSSRQSMV